MLTSNLNASGSPGVAARWTSSAKAGVGTALSNNSRVWFTLSHGIFNEICPLRKEVTIMKTNDQLEPTVFIIFGGIL